MDIYINQDKLKGFELTTGGGITAPNDFGTELNYTSKEIFKIIARYCLVNKKAILNGREFQELIEDHVDITKNVMTAIVNLKQNHYLNIMV